MRVGIDIRALQGPGRERGIGSFVRGLLDGLAGLGEWGDARFVLLDNHRPAVPARLDLPLPFPCSRMTLPFLDGNRLLRAALVPVRFSRWLNPAHALRRRGMRYDDILRRQLDRMLLARAARRARLDVLHLPSVFEPDIFAGVGAGFPCPVVQTVYDLIPFLFADRNRNAGWRYWFMQESGRKSLAHGRLAAISRSAASDTEHFVPGVASRTTVIYPGVPSRFAPPGAASVDRVRARVGVGDAPYVLTSGGCDWRKNLPVALRAFSHVRADAPHLRLLVPGRLSSPERVTLAQWSGDAGVTMGQDVLLPGYIEDADLPALYAGALALLFPSQYEGFGLPVVEAMRCGCPVVTARNSSLPEAAGDAALFVDDADDAGALSCQLRRLLREPGLAAALRARGFQHAASFTWEHAASAYLALYQDAASGT